MISWIGHLIALLSCVGTQNSGAPFDIGTVKDIVIRGGSDGRLSRESRVSVELGRFPIALYLPKATPSQLKSVLAELCEADWIEENSNLTLKWSPARKKQLSDSDRRVEADAIATSFRDQLATFRLPSNSSERKSYIASVKNQASVFLANPGDHLKRPSMPLTFIVKAMADSLGASSLASLEDFTELAYATRPLGVQRTIPSPAKAAITTYRELFKDQELYPTLRSLLERQSIVHPEILEDGPQDVTVHVGKSALLIRFNATSFDRTGRLMENCLLDLRYRIPLQLQIDKEFEQQLRSTSVQWSGPTKGLIEAISWPEYMWQSELLENDRATSETIHKIAISPAEHEIWQPFLFDILSSVNRSMSLKGIAILPDDSWLKVVAQGEPGSKRQFGSILAGLEGTTAARIWLKDDVLYIRPRLLLKASTRNCDRNILQKYSASLRRDGFEDLRSYCAAVHDLGLSAQYGSFSSFRKMLAANNNYILYPVPFFGAARFLGSLSNTQYMALLDGEPLRIGQTPEPSRSFGLNALLAGWFMFSNSTGPRAISDRDLDLSCLDVESLARVQMRLHYKEDESFLRSTTVGGLVRPFARPMSRSELVDYLAVLCKKEDVIAGGPVGEVPLYTCQARRWVFSALEPRGSNATLCSAQCAHSIAKTSTPLKDLPKETYSWVLEQLRKRFADRDLQQ